MNFKDRKSFQSLELERAAEESLPLTAPVHFTGNPPETTTVSVKRTRFCYCCAFLLSILLTLTLTVFLFYPQSPALEISPLALAPDSGAQSFQMSGNYQTASPDAPFSVSFSVSLNISIDSTNFIEWKLKQVIISAAFTDQNVTIPNAAAAAHLEDVVLPARSSRTLTLPLRISYRLTSPTPDLLQDPGFLALVAPCPFIHGVFKGATVLYSVYLLPVWGVISALGISIDGGALGCPVNTQELDMLLL
ncbi:MAG: hypothetical protein SGCHY_000836 [Lobulomycetales sp.]